MKKIVIEIISELFDIKVSEISLTSSFEYLEIDNLDLAELIMALEDKLEITADNNMYYTKTVGELTKQVIKHVNKKK